MDRRTRVYADTSVFGGVWDREFAVVTRRFFAEIRSGKYVILISEVTARELEGAPSTIRRFMAGLPPSAIEPIIFSREMAELRDAYLAAGVLAAKWRDDAAHVAAATVARADLIVSWNFRHLVKWDKIRAFNSVNLSLGYPVMTILSPREVITDEKGL